MVNGYVDGGNGFQLQLQTLLTNKTQDSGYTNLDELKAITDTHQRPVVVRIAITTIMISRSH